MFGLGRTIYYLQRYLTHRESDKNTRERERQQRSWTAVRAAAAQSRLKQKSQQPSTPPPPPLATKVERIDLPPKDAATYDNSGL